MKRMMLLVSMAATALALAPTSAIASTTYVESVFGFETGPPQSSELCPSPDSVSSFAGFARGTLNGVFQIGVCHTALNPGATIVGGVFAISNGTTTVTGNFASNGSVSFLGRFTTGALCVERFAVSGDLLPAGNFGGRLVHYGFWTGTACNVFFATISGNALITV